MFLTSPTGVPSCLKPEAQQAPGGLEAIVFTGRGKDGYLAVKRIDNAERSRSDGARYPSYMYVAQASPTGRDLLRLRPIIGTFLAISLRCTPHWCIAPR